MFSAVTFFFKKIVNLIRCHTLLILLIKSKIVNILIDSSSLNIFSSLLSHLSQIMERANVLLRIQAFIEAFNFSLIIENI